MANEVVITEDQHVYGSGGELQKPENPDKDRLRRVSFGLEEDSLAALEAISNHLGESRSHILRVAVNEYLTRNRQAETGVSQPVNEEVKRVAKQKSSKGKKGKKQGGKKQDGKKQGGKKQNGKKKGGKKQGKKKNK